MLLLPRLLFNRQPLTSAEGNTSLIATQVDLLKSQSILLKVEDCL